MSLKQISSALNPNIGNSMVERWGPLLIVICWLLATMALIFGMIPPVETTVGGYGILSAYAGYYLKSNVDE